MQNPFTLLFPIPDHQDMERNRVAKLAYWATLLLVLGGGIGLTASIISGTPESRPPKVMAMLAFMLVGSIFFTLIRFDYIEVVRYAHVAFSLAVIAGEGLFLGGVSIGFAVGVVLVLFLVGFLLGTKETIVVAFLEIALIWTIYFFGPLAQNGPTNPTDTSDAAVLSACVVVATMLCVFVIDHVSRFYVDVVQKDAALEQMSNSLKQTLVSKDYFNDILESMDDALIVTDTNGKIQLINQRVMKLLGYQEDHLIDRSITLLLNPAEPSTQHLIREFDVAYLFEALHGGYLGGKECQMIHRNGQSIDILLSLSKMSSSENLVFVAQNISTLKRVQNELKAAVETAEFATAAKSEFLANMSHEIRTPLNSILGLTNLVLASDIGDEQRHSLNVVKDSGQSLLTILNDLLDFSKIEAGKLELESIDFDLWACTGYVHDLIAPQIIDKDVSLSVQIDPDVPKWVKGDVTRIRQILTNLASNSAKFTEKGSVKISWSRLESKKIGRVRLLGRVSDTGIGVPPDKLNTLFQSFSQADTSMTRRYGGTGLGLSICQQLVTLMNGTIRVESVVGEGTTFEFEIECGVAQAPRGVTRPAPIAAEFDETLGQKHPLSILLVEDNRVNQLVARKTLKKLGYEVDLAQNGQEALDAVGRSVYDLILMDIQMPIMDGVDATKAIRKHRTLDYQPRIVALTANVLPGDRDVYIEAGMDDHLSKPIRIDAVIQILSTTDPIMVSAGP